MTTVTNTVKTPEKASIIAKTLAHPLGNFGSAKLVGIAFRPGSRVYGEETSSRVALLSIFIPKGYYNVLWCGKMERIFFPNTIINVSVTFLPKLTRNTKNGLVETKSVMMYYRTIFMSPDNYSSVHKNGFYHAGFANTHAGKLCCPAFTIYPGINKQYADIDSDFTKLDKAIATGRPVKIREVTENTSIKTLINSILHRYMNTNFNNDYWMSGWPMSGIAEGKDLDANTGREVKNNILRRYAKLGEKEVLSIPSNSLYQRNISKMQADF